MATSITYLKKMLLNPNVKAAITTIRTTEGTLAADGHFYLYGSSPRNKLRFTDLSKHPNSKQTHNGITSTAAGIGQILYGTYVNLCKIYKFTDFSLETQELMIVALFDDCNTLRDIANGYMFREDVLRKLSNIWASLPLSRHGQPTHSVAETRGYYTKAGGVIGSAATPAKKDLPFEVLHADTLDEE